MQTSDSKIEKENLSATNNFLKLKENRPTIRFITCGSVDDGKSTLIGRLLYDSKSLTDDQLSQLINDSHKLGTQGEKIDYALLVDGLIAEQEQGITIDVAYRFFSTKYRNFIVLDTPGHEQYTRNMVTGASTADAAIVLIDARKGVIEQTRRHSYICNLLGIKNFIVAVNKIDLLDDAETVFNEIKSDFYEFASEIGLKDFVSIPVSGLRGDNIYIKSKFTNWHQGPTLLEALEAFEAEERYNYDEPFKMQVQWVNRRIPNFRGYSGKIVAGKLSINDEICVLPSEKTTKVKSIVTFDGELDVAFAGQSVTITTNDEIDCSRGQLITSTKNKPIISDQFNTTLVWLSDAPLIVGRTYDMLIGSSAATVRVTNLKNKVSMRTLEKLAASELEANQIGTAIITTNVKIPFTSYCENKHLGSFILIDKDTGASVCAGMINFSLNRAQNLKKQAIDVNRNLRAKIKNQRPVALWMTGISGSGKSTIANALERKLTHRQFHTFILDGDNVRHGLNKDLGFSVPDRIENIRRNAEVTKLMLDAGLIVITSFISPFQSDRDAARKLMPDGEFIEIFIDTPIEIAEARDVKGLYAKARAGKVKNFTGLDSKYEKPTNPEITINTSKMSAEKAADEIIEYLFAHFEKYK